ncbi:MAG: 30S ribosomal protein S13 [Chloroflexi bacterium]|nr:30S ribosomal protein S13 [Chloroflexota bacterium]MAV14483.1 30S ribosomal protein S13 [Chloroflexota bacterium]|tara:strand:+ start:431 stop:814 length:384 start_codon:yes stop_codon:yes gene_type:complete
MAVVKGVNIPDNKRVEIALTSIFGIGMSRAKKIVSQAGISDNPKVHEIPEDKLNLIRNLVDSYEEPLEGDLRRSIRDDIKRLGDIKTYRGDRHRRGLPVRGQRTKTNARTKRGKKIAIAGKKQVTKH